MNQLRRSKWRAVWLCGMLWVAAAAWQPAEAQDSEAVVLARIETAFAQGNVAGLLERAADRLDITMFGTSAVYSRAQAQYVLEGFFRDYPPRPFRFQEPSRRDENCFVTGRYGYGDDPLRVYVRLRRQGADWELREIRIDHKAGN